MNKRKLTKADYDKFLKYRELKKEFETQYEYIYDIAQIDCCIRGVPASDKLEVIIWKEMEGWIENVELESED